MKKNNIIIIAFAIAMAAISQANAQNAPLKLGSNPTTINANSVLEMESSNKGMLLPRVALSATTNIAPLTAHIAGMVVYNTATAGSDATAVTPGYYYNDGSQWVRLAAGGNGGNVSLPVTNLVSNNSPVGNTPGQLLYNTNPNIGLPVGPVYWNGNNWVPLNATATEPWYNVATNAAATSNTQNIYQTGNVGIRTSTPLANLHVVGSAAFGNATAPATWTSNGSDILLNTGAANSQIFLRPNGDGSPKNQFRVRPLTGHSFFGFDGLEKVRIDTTGNVGIGTTAPATPLDIVGGVVGNGIGNTNDFNVLTKITNNVGGSVASSMLTGPFMIKQGINATTTNVGGVGAFSIVAAENGNISFPVSYGMTSKNLVFNSSGGNVGIGTTIPAARLDVAGQVKISGGTPGVGKVLTSDADGLASWTTPAAAGVSSVSGTAPIAVAGTTTPVISLNDGGVTTLKLADNAVTTAKIENGTIVANDIADNTITGAKILGNTINGSKLTPQLQLNSGGTGLGSEGIMFAQGGLNKSFIGTTATGNDAGTNVAFGIQPLNSSGNGTNAISVLHNGNVGIGTNSAAAKLDVAGQVKISGGAPGAGKVLTSDASGLASWSDPVTIASTNIYSSDGTLAGARTLTQGANALTFDGAGNFIKTGGKVGIGTIAPYGNLHVNSASATTIRLSSTSTTDDRNQVVFGKNGKEWNIGTDLLQTNADNFYIWQEGPGVGLLINDAGNVGIGTATPNSRLEVNGAATNSSANIVTGASIDYSLSNLAATNNTGTAITLSNLKNGGAYTLVFTSTAASGAVTFTAAGFTFVEVGTVARTSGKKHIYNFIVIGTEVYVTMGTQN